MDDIESKLERAGHVGHDDPAVADALGRMVAASRPPRSSRARRWMPALGIGAALLAVGAPVAVAATGWGPWTVVTEPQLVVERSWFAVDGTPLGTCASHFATYRLPDEALETALATIESLDVDSLEPDPERVAGGLNSAGRLDEISRLVSGAEPGDFDVRHEGAPVEATDARVLHDAMLHTVSRAISRAIFAAHPELGNAGIEMAAETQCAPAP